jgi:uncharacterized protein (DUF58 family)
VRSTILVSDDVEWALSLAHAWTAQGDQVTLVLLDTAVAATRQGAAHQAVLAAALRAGIAVLAEERALQRRVLGPSALLDGVKVLRLDELADLLVDDSDKAVWL